jgi:hypothetical protein
MTADGRLVDGVDMAAARQLGNTAEGSNDLQVIEGSVRCKAIATLTK